MTAGKENSDRASGCPRCGAPLRRRRRHVVHRLISILYPVRAYECTAECNWTGVLPSRSQLTHRKRQLRRGFVVVVLAVAAGLAIWKYGAGLTWSPPRPPAGDEAQESSAGE